MRHARIAISLLGWLAFATAYAREMRPEHNLNSYGVVETLPGMDKVRVTRDVTYKTASGTALQMDVYAPPGGMTADPDLGPVRNDPRFAEILKKIG